MNIYKPKKFSIQMADGGGLSLHFVISHRESGQDYFLERLVKFPTSKIQCAMIGFKIIGEFEKLLDGKAVDGWTFYQ